MFRNGSCLHFFYVAALYPRQFDSCHYSGLIPSSYKGTVVPGISPGLTFSVQNQRSFGRAQPCAFEGEKFPFGSDSEILAFHTAVLLCNLKQNSFRSLPSAV